MHVIKRFADQTDKKEKTDSEDGDRYRKRERMVTGRREKTRTDNEDGDRLTVKGKSERRQAEAREKEKRDKKDGDR